MQHAVHPSSVKSCRNLRSLAPTVLQLGSQTLPRRPSKTARIRLGPVSLAGYKTRMDVRSRQLGSVAREDAVAWLRSFPAGSVDLVITDPPYESLEKHRAVGTTTRLKHSKASSNDWFSIFPNVRFPELFRELFRVMRRDRHLYLFCDPETAFIVKPMGEAAGFKFWKPLVWDKKRIGMGYHYRARYEFILFFEKGKRKLNDLGVADIIESPRIYNGYPSEKPVEVAEVFVRQSTEAGELVLDPFMGSCSTGVAAARLKRRFAGADTCAEAVDIARRRLADAGVQLDAHGLVVPPARTAGSS
jgi:site-specific DNA-methyltransferase (adenine-specific)